MRSSRALNFHYIGLVYMQINKPSIVFFTTTAGGILGGVSNVASKLIKKKPTEISNLNLFSLCI